MKKLIFSVLISTFCWGLPLVTSAVVVEVPPSQGYQDIIVGPTTRVSAKEDTLFGFIQLINQYIRFSLAVVCFVVLVYGGYKLITAAGDAGKLTEATTILTNAGIGILIAILSYSVVRVVINLI